MSASERPLVVAVLPALARLVEERLRAQEEDVLADAIGTLRITGACACENDFCGSFYTAGRPFVRWWRRGRQLLLEGDPPAEVILDVVGGEIVFVEVLHWEGVREAVAHATRA